MPLTRRSVLVAGLAFLATGCATRPSLMVANEIWPELEPVGVTAGREGLTVRFASRGCTVKADIVFRLDRSGGRTILAFARRRLETCRFGDVGTVDLCFGYDALGLKRGERYLVANPSL